jgi:hypothetical protein
MQWIAPSEKDALTDTLEKRLWDSADQFRANSGLKAQPSDCSAFPSKIDSGLARSRFGVVVLSQAFLGKGWTNYELDGLVTRAVSDEQVLLPIWHNITKKEVFNTVHRLATSWPAAPHAHR